MIFRRPLLLIILVAAIFRAAATLPLSLHHPDEVFQYLEQAHRLVFGYGIVPWEYRYGMRSWLLPLLVAGPMQIGAWIAPSTLLYAKLPQLLAAMANLSIVWSAWEIGKRSHPSHGLVAAAVMAIWFEQIFFASHLLTEVLATACFLPAAVLLTASVPSQRKLMAAGILLGLAVIFRFHYGPAIAVLVLLSCKFEVKRLWLPILAGGALALTFSATVDILAGQKPFGWMIENIQQNLILNRSAHYGVSGPETYFVLIRSYWHFAALPIFLLILPAVRNNQTLLWVAFLNIAIHVAIGHKEYRFIFLSMTILIMLAAIGSAELAHRLRTRVNNTAFQKSCMPALIALWIGVSGTLAIAEPMRQRWNAYGPSMGLARLAGNDPNICGIAIHNLAFWEPGGYSYLHRKIPIFLTGWSADDKMSVRDIKANSSAFNMIIASPVYGHDIPSNYARSICLGQANNFGDPTRTQCLYKRFGSCDPAKAAKWKIGDVLLRHDQ